MSSDNVEVVRRVMEAWERGERVAPGLLDEEVEWINPPEAVESGTRRGASGFKSAQENFGRAFDTVRFEVEETVGLGDRVLVLTESVFRGRGSDIKVRRPLAFLWTLQGGRVTRFQWFNDHQAARAVCDERAQGE